MNSNSTAGGGNLARQLYLIWKALNDPSIPWAAKWLIPIAALVYTISPIDLIPFFPLDDIVVIFVALNFFMRTIAQYQTQKAGPSGSATPGAQGPANQHTAADQDGSKTIETTWRVIE